MAVENCPTCGAELKPEILGGLCPRCVCGTAATAVQSPTAVAGGTAQEVPDGRQSADAIPREPPGEFGQRGSRVGDYELVERIGRGGMGVVYKARQVSLHRTVALKMLGAEFAAMPNLSERLRIEAEAAASLDHPNIVTIHEVGEQKGQPFFTMQLVEGQDLNRCISREGFHLRTVGSSDGDKRVGPQATAARLLAKVARAVDYAHQHGVLHRDLKPSNILVDQAGEPHLTDFGLAKIMGRAQEFCTGSGSICGTLGFMAPEQARGSSKAVGTSADIHGLGAILYAMLTGRPPFRGEAPAETLRQTIEEDAKPPSTVHAGIDRDLEIICLKCLEKEPGQRYRSALALAEDLERWLRREAIEARPMRFVGRLWRWCRREPAIAGMVVGGLVLMTAIAVLASTLLYREKEKAHRAREGRNRNVKALLARTAEGGAPEHVHVSAEELATIADFEWLGDVTDKRIDLTIHSPERISERTMEPLARFVQYLHTNLWKRADFPAFFDLNLYHQESNLLARLLQNEADLYQVDPATFVQARRQLAGLAFVARQVYRYKAGLRGVILTCPESGITNLTGLKGRSFAFGEVGTALGWYLPRAALAEAGLRAHHFQRLTNMPSALVLSAVRKHAIDAGVVVWEDPENEPQRLAKAGVRFRVLKGLECAGPLWVSPSGKMPANHLAALQEVFHSTQDEKLLNRLDSQLIGFIPVRLSDYEPLDQQIEQAKTFDSP
jgi:ABC-type phosphate/phosphonate transport system substrate-binding protein/tRNA A-37 threonylcarbamoyl transferase component Bud32